MRPLERIIPNGPPGAYDTYGVRLPRATHTRPVTCAAVGCPHYERGWACTVMPNSQEEADVLAAADGRTDGHRRHFRPPTRTPEGWNRYVFPAGQPCFAVSAHVEQVKPAITVVGRGDWRKSERPRVVGSAEWSERFQENQLAIIDRQQRG